MVRFTQHHGFPLPESSDPAETVAETIGDLIEDLDRVVILRGLLANRPPAGIAGRFYLSTDESVPTLYYDDGEEWVSPATYGDPPPNLLKRDEDQQITAQYTFDEPIIGDLLGHAETATEAELAHEAEDAHRLGGFTEDEYTRTDQDQTITGERTFETEVVAAGVRVDGGTVDLPGYTGGDPVDRRVGSIWFRNDRQPLNPDDL